MDAAKLKEILEKHLKWINGENGGERANLSGANLFGANLSGANLFGANLSGADLSEADLFKVNFMKSDWKTITHLEYTRAMLSGLLNFCYRSGLADGGACPDCELCQPDMDRLHCRCCYASVLKTAIQAVDEKMEREGIKPPPEEPHS